MSDTTDLRSKTKTFPKVETDTDTYASMMAGGYLLNTLMSKMIENSPVPHTTVTIQLNDRIVEGNCIGLERDGVLVEYFEQGIRLELLINNLSKITLI